MRQLLTDQATTSVAAWVRLLRAHSQITLTFNRQLVAEHGMTINDFEALLVLSYAGDGIRRVDLAERLQLTASGVTRLLDRLEAEGWVKKRQCAEDARVSYAVLTPKGRKKLEEASDSHSANVAALFSERYTKKELEQLVGLLDRLPGAAGADPEACRPG